MLICLWILSGLVPIGDKTWSDTQLDRIFMLLNTEGAEAAKAMAAEKETTLYDVGVRLLRAKGVNEGLIWYKALVDAYQDPQYLYGMARAHWKARDLDSTRSICLELLKLDPSRLLLARIQYLLGRVEHFSNNMATAKRHYRQCYELYDQLDKNGGRYLACFGMAAVLIDEKDFVGAREYMEKARAFNANLSNPYPSAHLENLEGEIALNLGDYEKALTIFQKAHSSDFGNDKETEILLLIKTGLTEILLGRYEAGYQTAKLADGLIYEQNLTIAYHYNNAVWMLIYRCGGEEDSADYKRLRKGFTDSAMTKATPSSLLRFLEFVESVSCPEKVEEE